MLRWFKRAASCLLVFLIAVIPVVPANASENLKTVRVGYFEDGDYMYRTKDGLCDGFNTEYLYGIAKYTDWNYEFVDFAGWEAAYAALKKGEIDLLPSVYQTAAREEEVLFSEQQICRMYSTLNVRLDDQRYVLSDFDSFQGMRVGVIQGSVDAQNFVVFCEENGITAETVPFLETGEAMRALEEGLIDGLAITHLGKNSVFRSVAQFAPEPLYIAVAKNQPELLKQLDGALDTLKMRDPNYDIKLFDKYFAVSNSQTPVFTKEEAAYLAEAGTITAVYDPAWRPLEYQNADGEFTGITADLFQKIEELTGLQFEFVPRSSYADTVSMLGDGSAQVLCCLIGDYLSNARNNIRATGSYLTAPVAKITSGKSGKERTVAMIESRAPKEEVWRDGKDLEIRYYKSVEACFLALVKGDADIVYANTYVVNDLLSLPKYESLQVAMLSNYQDELCVGVSASADPRLFSILDKCVQFTASEQVDEWILKNTIQSEAVTWEAFLRQHPVELTLFFLAVTAVLLYVLFLKTKNAKRIQKLLYLDSLTELWNLNKFTIEAQRLTKNAQGGAYALVYTDISQFKTINDAFGFLEGDLLLKAYAKVLIESIRGEECCARASADQFALLLRYENWEELLDRTDEIDRRINAWRREQGKPYSLVLVFGVYVVADKAEQDVSLMLDFANYARRSAKVAHMSQTVLYDEAMRKQELRQRELADQMEGALKNGEFVPYFQAKVNMQTGSIVGCEALARWIHPERGILAPAAFLPYFEKNRFVVELDFSLFQQVCAAIRDRMEEGKPPLSVSCNFSRLHFENGTFPEKLKAVTDRYGVPPSAIDLEVTESVLFGDMDQVLEQFRTLKQLGFRLDIDDFGTGYSSLGLLEQMPVDVIKLDKSFLDKGMYGKREQSIIRGIVRIAEDLEIEVVCEGVETKRQVEYLTQSGCHTAQGFYYARPVPLEEFLKMLDQSK